MDQQQESEQNQQQQQRKKLLHTPAELYQAWKSGGTDALEKALLEQHDEDKE